MHDPIASRKSHDHHATQPDRPTRDELDTPALLLDLEPFEHNIDDDGRPLPRTGRRVAAARQGVQVPGDRHILRRAGAIGVTVAKVSEAEVMAAGGIDDILIAHLVVGPSKPARLAALQRQADVKVTVDHPDHVARLGQAATRAGVDDRRAGRRRPRDEATRRAHRRRAVDARAAGFGQPRAYGSTA